MAEGGDPNRRMTRQSARRNANPFNDDSGQPSSSAAARQRVLNRVRGI